MSARPPAILRRMLAWILPTGRVRDGLLGDLDELYAERARHGRLRANAWYTRQVLSAAVAYALPAPAHKGGLSGWLGDLAIDSRQALRMLLRRPGFTVVVVLTLALGIGATTAIFSVVDAVLLRPLPYPEPDRLVRVLQYRRDDDQVTGSAPLSRENFADLRQVESVYESVAAFSTGTRVLTGVGEPREVPVAHVSPDFFRTLEVQAALGRTIGPADELAGSNLVAVLSDSFWRSRFGSDPGVTGRTVVLDGIAFTVTGVMPPSFDYPSRETDVYLPVSLLGCDDVNCSRASRFLLVVARLAPDATLHSASAGTRALFGRLEEAYPETNNGWTAGVVPLRDELVGDVRPELLVLFGAVGFLLLITCANVANLLLARGARRSREFVIRTALGAGRGRMIRQVLTESMSLAAIGGALGFLLAVQGVALLVALGGGSIPRSYVVEPDLRVAAFAAIASLVTGLLFGSLPSITASRVDLHDGLKKGAGGTRRATGRGLLIGLETALAVVLVTGAALLVESFWKLTRIPTGFTSENVLAVSLRTDGDVMSGEERNTYRRELVSRIAALPGVLSAGGAKDVPLQGISEAYSFTLPERPDEPMISPQTLIVTGDYFGALGIPLRAGRLFTAADETDHAAVVIVNQAMAGRYWPEGGAVGETLRLLDRVPVQVVGVVGDVRYNQITDAPAPTLYVLPHFGGRASMTLFVRTASDPLALADAVRRTIWEVNPQQPVEVSTMRQVVSSTVAEPRFLTVLLGSFAGLALVLALLGVYGVIAFEVGRRTYEVGVRIALGARSPDVLRLIVAQGALPLAAGLLVGLVVARGLSGVLAALLYGVAATDPVIFTTVPLALGALGLLAAYVPARRATRVDPNSALRAE